MAARIIELDPGEHIYTTELALFNDDGEPGRYWVAGPTFVARPEEIEAFATTITTGTYPDGYEGLVGTVEVREGDELHTVVHPHQAAAVSS